MQTLTVPLSESFPNSNNKKEVSSSSRVNEVIKRIAKSRYAWAGVAGIVIADLIDDTSTLRPVLGSALGKLTELFDTQTQSTDQTSLLLNKASPGINTTGNLIDIASGGANGISISDTMPVAASYSNQVQTYDMGKLDSVVDFINKNPVNLEAPIFADLTSDQASVLSSINDFSHFSQADKDMILDHIRNNQVLPFWVKRK
ncbi:hypothetical protein KBD45_01765 [Candidatus Dojkabacteria bacterium]|nr:hypothetical protein [Candidatus Dojkabacteria bacterium]